MKPQAEDLLRKGYKILNTVSDTGRNLGLRVEKDGMLFFAKVNLTKHPELIANDLWFCDEVNRRPDLPVRAPRIFEHSDHWYVSEFLEGELLAPSLNARPGAIAATLPLLVEILVAFDQIKVDRAGEPLYGETESAPYTNLLKKVDGWMKTPLQSGLIDQQTINRAKALIERYRSEVKPGFQHGDFVPWHIMKLVNGQRVLFDGEHASALKPRFYDLCYAYTRFFTRSKSKPEAKQLLSAFVSRTGSESLLSELLPVMTLRSLGMHADATADLKRIDYRAEAQELLAICFEEKLEALTD